MKLKKYIKYPGNYFIGAGVILLALLSVFFIFRKGREQGALTYSEDYVAVKELPSQLSFTYYTKEEWEKKLEETGAEQKAGEKLTYGTLEQLLSLLSLKDYVKYESAANGKTVPRAVWNEVYAQILDLLDSGQTVALKNLVFLTEEAEKASGEGEAESSPRRLTQEGYVDVAEGVDYFGYYDMYQVYVRENQIIGVRGGCKEQVKLENVFLHSAKEEKAEILYEGQSMSLDIAGLTEEIQDTICDMVWQDRKVTAIYKKQDMISGKVLSFNDTQIEISGYGTLEHAGKLKIYKTYGTVEQLDESKLVIGNLQADFVVAEKKVCGIILKQPAEIENIRVLLLSGGSTCHGNPLFVSDVETTVTVGDQTQNVAAGQLIVPAQMLPEGTADFVKIAVNDGNGRLYLAKDSGEPVSPGYRGTMEIRKYPEGYGVVNEVTMEQYLYGVVPSEMPASYEREALRAQAVCARSYACIQLMKGAYTAFAAHVDDSTNYQVYNKNGEEEQSNLAVDDTVGEVIKYNGQVAEAYYFSTSCGHTNDMGVWNQPVDGENSYLQGTSLLTDGSGPDLANEETFRAFIQDTQVQAYDSDAAYFRWKARLSIPERKEAVNAGIGERFRANPQNVQITKADGSGGGEGDLSSFGNITGISVEERSSGGCIRKLHISYEQGNVVLLSEYNVRAVLGKAMAELTDKNGNQSKMSLLPSAYAAVIPVDQGYTVYGGGYGHGIGMSQNGANGMAKAGMSYTDILSSYYSQIAIENIYNGE